MAAGNTILVNPRNSVVYKEGIASATIKPGHVIRESTVEVEPNPPTVGLQNSAGGNDVLQVAIEDSLQGKGTDDNYASGSVVRSVVLQPGDRFQGWLKDGEVGAFGARLSYNGDGTFQVATGTEVVKAILRKAGSPSGADALLLMEAV